MTREPEAVPLDAPADYPFPKDQDGFLSWSNVLARLQESRIYWLATTRRDGRPHVAPLWGVWNDNILYFEGSPSTRWARNLDANSAASINLESGLNAVIAEGIAEHFTLGADLRDQLIAAWSEKYGKYGPQPETEGLYRFRPSSARAFSESLDDGTRWLFKESEADSTE